MIARRKDAVLPLTVLVFVLASGCGGREQRSTADRIATPAAAESEPLPAVVLPDLSALAPTVQQQIRDRYRALTARLADAGAAPADRAAAYGDLGHLLLAAKFGDAAAVCFRHAEALAANDVRWPYALGHAYLLVGDRARAAAAFERAATLGPDAAIVRVWLGETYLDAGRADAARAAFDRALASDSASAAALFGAGRAALALQQYADAAQYLERALTADPRATAVHYPLAMAYRGLGERNKAEGHLRQRGEVWPELVDTLKPNADDLLESAVACEHRGMAALQRQDWPAAAAAFRRGLELQPSDANLQYWLGATLYASGDVAGAEKEFAAVLRESPHFARAHFSLAAVYDATGRHQQAVAEYAAAIRDDPTMVEAHVRLADARRAAGDVRGAMNSYETALRLDPRSADAWVGGAKTLLADRRRDEARDWIARARHVLPDRQDLAALQASVP